MELSTCSRTIYVWRTFLCKVTSQGVLVIGDDLKSLWLNIQRTFSIYSNLPFEMSFELESFRSSWCCLYRTLLHFSHYQPRTSPVTHQATHSFISHMYRRWICYERIALWGMFCAAFKISLYNRRDKKWRKTEKGIIWNLKEHLNPSSYLGHPFIDKQIKDK